MQVKEIQYEASASFAKEMDAIDPLKHFRERFFLPVKTNGEPSIYFCGNSLGLQPRTTRSYIEQELSDWEKLGVEGHYDAKHPWYPYHEFLTEPLTKLVGAKPNEVVAMNS